MLSKLKAIILSSALFLTSSATGLALITAGTSTAYAQAGCSGISSNVAKGVSDVTTGPNETCNSTDTSGTLTKIGKEVVDIFSILVGIVSVVMIIYGGFRYITSGGSSERVGTAKNVIIYAIIGLIIVALAQVIIHFVLSNSSSQVQSNIGT